MHIGVNSQRIAFSALVRTRALLVACASFCFVGIGVFFALAGGALATEATKPAQIDRNGVLILVRTTLLAVDAANKTGNYTVLRDLAAPGFGSANNAAKLGDIFASNRRDGLDLSGVAVLDPQLTRLPEIDENGMMRMAGFFPSVPKQSEFRFGLSACGRPVAVVRHRPQYRAVWPSAASRIALSAITLSARGKDRRQVPAEGHFA